MKETRREVLKPVLISVTIATVALAFILIDNRLLQNRPTLDRAAGEPNTTASTEAVVKAAGGKLIPTEPKSPLEPDPPGPDPIAPVKPDPN